MHIKETIQSYSLVLSNALKKVSEEGPKNYITYDFDFSFFNEFTLETIESCNEHLAYEEVLRKIKGPSVYWFEIVSEIESKRIRRLIIDYKKLGIKSVPSIKKNFDSDSKILYVGKVKRYFWSRIIQHLGYYKVKKTQGLQLYHWAKELDLKLRLHVYEFDEEMSNLVGTIEYKLARELKPIIGHHS